MTSTCALPSFLKPARKYGREYNSSCIASSKSKVLKRCLTLDSVFEDYTIQSAAENNTINLELPLPPLNRALKSAIDASSASLRLTKKDGQPILSLTIVRTHTRSGDSASGFLQSRGNDYSDGFREESLDQPGGRETIVTQDIPVRVLMASSVESIHEPLVREPDVHVLLPSLVQLKAISDRFTKLASATSSGNNFGIARNSAIPKLQLSANMHGSLKLSISTDALNISSVWDGLENPELDPNVVEDDPQDHPSTKFKEAGPDAWATVRIDGRDWGKVLSVGRMGGRVVACKLSIAPLRRPESNNAGFVDGHALILYVYLQAYEEGAEESVLTYYISSYSA
jgi:HUS1 checkpoint protein